MNNNLQYIYIQWWKGSKYTNSKTAVRAPIEPAHQWDEESSEHDDDHDNDRDDDTVDPRARDSETPLSRGVDREQNRFCMYIFTHV